MTGDKDGIGSGRGSSGDPFGGTDSKQKIERPSAPKIDAPKVNQEAVAQAYGPPEKSATQKIDNQFSAETSSSDNRTQPITHTTDAAPAAAKSQNPSVAATEGAALARGTAQTPSESVQDKPMAQQVESKSQASAADLATSQKQTSATESTHPASATNSKTQFTESEKTAPAKDQPQSTHPRDASSPVSGNENDRKMGTPGIASLSEDTSKNSPKTPVVSTDSPELKSKSDLPPAVIQSKNEPSAPVRDLPNELGRDNQSKQTFPESAKDANELARSDRARQLDSTGTKDKDFDLRSRQIEKQSEVSGSRHPPQSEKSPISDGKPDSKSLDAKSGAKAEAELLTIMDRHTVFDSSKAGRIPDGKGEKLPERPSDRPEIKAEISGTRPDGTVRSSDVRGDNVRPGDQKDPAQRPSDWITSSGGKIEVQVQGDVKVRLPHKDGQPELNLSDKSIQRELSNGFGLLDKQQFREFVAQHKSLVDFVTELPRRSFGMLKDIMQNMSDTPKTTRLREWAQDLSVPKEQPLSFVDRVHQWNMDHLQFWKRHESRIEQAEQSRQQTNEVLRRAEEAYQSVKEVFSNPISRILRAIANVPAEPIEKKSKTEEIDQLLNRRFPELVLPEQKPVDQEEDIAKPEAVKQQLPTSSPTIVTKDGDTANSLSEKCFGDIRCLPLLKNLNVDLPDDPYRPLKAGLVLNLPSLDEVEAFRQHFVETAVES